VRELARRRREKQACCGMEREKLSLAAGQPGSARENGVDPARDLRIHGARTRPIFRLPRSARVPACRVRVLYMDISPERPDFVGGPAPHQPHPPSPPPWHSRRTIDGNGAVTVFVSLDIGTAEILPAELVRYRKHQRASLRPARQVQSSPHPARKAGFSTSKRMRDERTDSPLEEDGIFDTHRSP